MKSFAKPTNEQIEAALPLLSSPQHQAYFFDRLENPLWIAPLAKRRVFTDPPRAEQTKEGGFRFPPWPPSRYLARMAVHSPAEVVEIIAKIETDNASVIGDIVMAAIAMPAVEAATLVPAISKAALEGSLWLQFENASELCVRLAESDKPDAALKLAKALYTPTFVKGHEEPSRRDAYWYKKGMAKVVPVLARVKPEKFLPVLCGWLEASVKANKHVISDSDDDGSPFWRPAMEEHEQNRDHDFAGNMAGFVREGFEAGIREGSISLNEALDIAGAHCFLIFKRLRIHLVAEFAEQNPDSACQLIMNRGLFDDYKYRHEYATLIGKRLDLLSPEQREQWFGWVDAGPDMSDFDESIQTNLGRESTDDDRKGRIAYWQFEKLHLARKHLRKDRLTYYEEMLAEHGEPEMADLSVRVSMGFGSEESPLEVEELKSKTFEQVVDTVSSWKPGGSAFMGPSIEGLALTFEQYLTTNPEYFSAKARHLIGRPANFVRSFVRAPHGSL